MLKEDFEAVIRAIQEYANNLAIVEPRLAFAARTLHALTMADRTGDIGFLALLFRAITNQFLQRAIFELVDMRTITSTELARIATMTEAIQADIHSLVLKEAGEGIHVKVSQQP